MILVNGNSASATEIVSGAVQDHDRGLIVGETTFGKGLVQTVTPLSENTGLALTTARYYTPSGRLIQRDYKSISLYEYHYERKVPEHPTEVKLTDSGRQVTGGGGITPDISGSRAEADQVPGNSDSRRRILSLRSGCRAALRVFTWGPGPPSPRSFKSTTW